MGNRAAQEYLRKVKRALDGDKADRNQLLERLESLLDTFQQENPGTDYAGFVAAFGEPAVCAAELLAGQDESQGEAAQQKHLRFYRIAVLGLAAALLFSVVLLVREIPQNDRNTGG